MAKQGIDWSSLWKKDEWLAVWIGFLIIILTLAGLKLTNVNFRWTGDGEFASFAAEQIPAVDKLIKEAGDKGEEGLAAQATALKAALESGNRKNVGDAIKCRTFSRSSGIAAPASARLISPTAMMLSSRVSTSAVSHSRCNCMTGCVSRRMSAHGRARTLGSRARSSSLFTLRPQLRQRKKPGRSSSSPWQSGQVMAFATHLWLAVVSCRLVASAATHTWAGVRALRTCLKVGSSAPHSWP